MVILIKIAQLILCLTLLVLVHEFGHFIAARIFKTRVDKFYIFFNPWFSLFKYKKGETEYGIGWLPLGGYVKIAGMIDESMDKEQMKKAPEPYEFRSKPAWQRFIIMIAGVFMNLVLAIGIYAGILATWGESYLPTSEVKYGIAVNELGEELGLRNGDIILSVDNKEVVNFNKLATTIILDKAKTIQVERNDQKVEVEIPTSVISKIIKSGNPSFIEPLAPIQIVDFAESFKATEASLQKEDIFLSINNENIFNNIRAFKNELQKHSGETVTAQVLRKEDTVPVVLQVNADGNLGIYLKTDFLKLAKKQYNILQAIPHGAVMAINTVDNYWKQLKLIFSKDVKAYESVGGFIAIGKIFPSTWNWYSFWALSAFLSVMFAVLNLLPIPALDGGHVLFVLIEMITGRKPSDKFLEYAQIFGMILLFALLIYANGNDVIKLINGR